ncbi:MAG: hypothetical protein LC792_16945 [Actinobacteria bacterium]|nr:hypothetical protein [Actinomycetota bacterium]
MLVEVDLGGGGVGLIVPWLELDRMEWIEYLRPLADCLAGKPDAVWTAKPIADDVDDRVAMGLR